MQAREAELLAYRISTLSSRCRRQSGHRLPEQGVIYDLLFKASAETMLTIAADPSTLAPASLHLGAAHLGLA